MTRAVTTLETGIADRSLGSGDKAIRLREVTGLNLAHEKMHVRWHHALVLGVDNVVPVGELGALLVHLTRIVFTVPTPSCV